MIAFQGKSIIGKKPQYKAKKILKNSFEDHNESTFVTELRETKITFFFTKMNSFIKVSFSVLLLNCKIAMYRIFANPTETLKADAQLENTLLTVQALKNCFNSVRNKDGKPIMISYLFKL